jgi:hypothetical protein
MPPTDFSDKKDIIGVSARIALRSTKEGGRQCFIRSGYRPNHVFEYQDRQIVSNIGEIQFDIDKLEPGEETIARVFFLKWPRIIPFITVGRKWWIHEGRHLVGTGEILKIFHGLP